MKISTILLNATAMIVSFSINLSVAQNVALKPVAQSIADMKNSNVSFKKTKSGLLYKIISSNNKDSVVKTGDWLKVQFSNKINDSVLNSSYGKMPGYAQVVAVDNMSYDVPEIFPMLRKGDSAIVVLLVDSLLRKITTDIFLSLMQDSHIYFCKLEYRFVSFKMPDGSSCRDCCKDPFRVRLIHPLYSLLPFCPQLAINSSNNQESFLLRFGFKCLRNGRSLRGLRLIACYIATICYIEASFSVNYSSI